MTTYRSTDFLQIEPSSDITINKQEDGRYKAFITTHPEFMALDSDEHSAVDKVKQNFREAALRGDIN